MSKSSIVNQHKKGKIVARGKTQVRAHSDVLEEYKVKKDYLRNTAQGRYYFSRCNMIAEQIIGKNIKENIDGAKKSRDFMLAEYAMTKLTARERYAERDTAKKTLIEKYKLTEEDLLMIEDDLYNGKIIREEYSVKPKKHEAAKFVSTEED